MNPKISVIIPFQNNEKFLEKCIRSILDQSYANLEIYCVNNNSTDNSLSIVNDYSSISKRVFVLSNNYDYAISINNIIMNSKGDYILFINPNSFLDKEFIHNLVQEVKYNNLDIIFSKHYFFNEDTQNIDFNFFNNLKYGISSCFNNFYKKDYLINNNILFKNNSYCSNMIFFYETLLNTTKFKFMVGKYFYNVFDKSSKNNILTNLKILYVDNINFIKFISDLKYFLNYFEEKSFHEFIEIDAISSSLDVYFSMPQDLQEKYYDNLKNFFIDVAIIDFDSNKLENKYQLLFNKFTKSKKFENLKNQHSEESYYLLPDSLKNEIELKYIEFNENKEAITLFFKQNSFEEYLECYIENTFYELDYYNKKNDLDKFFNNFKLTIPAKYMDSKFQLIFKSQGNLINYQLKLNNQFSTNSTDFSCTINKDWISLKKLNNTCKVSIIVPVYNVEDYLSECLDSICNQTLKDIEIICINDGSSDNSLDILNEYSKKDKRISVISKENGGQGVARNLGITLANGEYIGFVDSDDWIEEDMFEKLYMKAHKNNLDFNMCRLSLFNEQTGEYDNSTWYYGLKHFDSFNKDIFEYSDVLNFLTSISVTPVNKIYKRSFLLNHDLKFAEDYIFEDEAFFYSIIFKASKISLIKEELYYYRINRKNSTVTETKNNKDIVDIYRIVRKYLINNGFEKFISIVDNKFLKSIFSRFYQSDENHRKLFFNSFKELLNEWSLTKEIFDNNSTINKNDFLKSSFIKFYFNTSWEYLSNLENHIFHNLKKFIFANEYKDLVKFNNSKEFSIIMAVYNTEEYLEEAIDSVLEQDFVFESNIELILVDDGSTDSSREICLKYVESYPNNIKYLYQENQGQGTARNFGLSLATGKYINFLDSDDKLNYDVLSKVHKFFEENYDEVDVVSIPIILFDGQTGNHVLNYKYSSTRVVDLLEEPKIIQLSAASSFIKHDSLNSFTFSQELVVAEDALLINQILLEKNKLGVISDAKYLYRKRISDSSTMDSTANLNIYLPKFKLFYKALFDYAKNKMGFIPEFIQFTIMYDMKWYLYFTDIENILNKDDLKIIHEFLNEILQDIDDKIINMQDQLHETKKKYIFCLKYENNLQILQNYNKLYKYAGKNKIDFLNHHRIYIDIVDVKNDSLNISGMFRSFFTDEVEIQAVKFDMKEFLNEWINFLNEHKKIFLNDANNTNIKFNLKNIPKLLNRNIINKNEYEKNYDKKLEEFLNKQDTFYKATEVNYPYRDEKFFGLSFESSLCFDVSIPLTSKTFSVGLRVNYNKINYYLKNILFDYSGLSEDSWYSKKRDKLISFRNNFFYIMPYSKRKMVKLELKNIDSLKKKENNLSTIINIRKKVLLHKLFSNKRIWLFMDRKDHADDNAEALFKYSLSQNDNIKKYFILNKDSSDFDRLKQYENIIEFGSMKHKILYLLAEKIISSHPDEEVLNPFWPNDFKYISGIIPSKRIFLQHGITKDNISRWLKKYDKHVELIVTVSDLEKKSFLDYYYNYSEDTVQILGFPRYDNLCDLGKNKQILIMPSWRNNLENKNENQIISSNYFKKINSLINNEKFIDLAKSKGYKIIFKPHPNVYKFIHLFDRNDYVKFDESTRYQDLFNTSSLLITDYSSVAFDFSYIKKPILYYQYANDYNFKEGYFDYETMGFGEIVEYENDLIDIVEEYIETNCKMKKEYSSRVETFYKYLDKNNCKRVYDFIKKID